jgi:hypothetical protein
LFRGKSSNDEDDEGTATAVPAKPSAVSLMAAAVPAKSADPVPVPRSKPAAAATFQLASADAQLVPPGKPSKQTPAPASAKTEPKPQTPADIINARGFWGDTPAAAKQATPEQVAALRARQAVTGAGADPQSTASISAAFQALAYAPAAAPPAERANVVTASAPIPRGVRPASPARNPMAVNNITTVVAKGSQGLVATSTRLASAAKSNDVWMRAMILAPSASTSMSVAMMGDPDMTLMRSYFVKPLAAVAMSFSDDPQLGLVCDQFTGPAVAKLATQSFVMRTASLR